MVNTEYAWINEIKSKSNPFENAVIDNLYCHGIKEFYEYHLDSSKDKPTFENFIAFMKEYFLDDLIYAVENNSSIKTITSLFNVNLDVSLVLKDVEIKFHFFNQENMYCYDFNKLTEDEKHDLIMCDHFPIIDITFSKSHIDLLKVVNMVSYLGNIINDVTGINCISVNGIDCREIEEDSF